MLLPEPFLFSLERKFNIKKSISKKNSNKGKALFEKALRLSFYRLSFL